MFLHLSVGIFVSACVSILPGIIAFVMVDVLCNQQKRPERQLLDLDLLPSLNNLVIFKNFFICLKKKKLNKILINKYGNCGI